VSFDAEMTGGIRFVLNARAPLGSSVFRKRQSEIHPAIPSSVWGDSGNLNAPGAPPQCSVWRPP
jgi:hypothetical protein